APRHPRWGTGRPRQGPATFELVPDDPDFDSEDPPDAPAPDPDDPDPDPDDDPDDPPPSDPDLAPDSALAPDSDLPELSELSPPDLPLAAAAADAALLLSARLSVR